MIACPTCGRGYEKNDMCWHCFVHYEGGSQDNASCNIAVPEKRLRWEDADRQYHGDLFFEGEY